MLHAKSKFSLKYLLFLILSSGAIMILTFPKAAQASANSIAFQQLKSDTTLPKSVKDTIKQTKVDTMQLKISKDSINAPVDYKAEDSMVLDIDTKKIFLYGKTEVKFEDIVLNAPKIVFDQQTQYVLAKMGRDSSGLVTGMAKLKQGETVTVSDSLSFNFKSQKGLTYSSFFQQDEFFNYAEKVKKIDQETFFAARGRFTTCNLDTPHFAFRFAKAKFMNKKLVVTGPVHPEFEDVPVPLYLPFGIFPMKKGRQSGILPPQFTVTEDFGIGLEGLGYYKAFNEYLDAKLWFDLYSYGSWRANFSPSYRVRYKYNGSFNISIQNTKFAFKGDPDFRKNQSFFVTWAHSMDSKARPGVSFSANVNAGSSKYLSLVPNAGLVNPGFGGNVQGAGNYQQPMNFTNQLSSSISYQKNWQGTPFNLAVNLNHNQNTSTRLVNLNLPDIAFVMNTIYPFQRKEAVGESKWYEKLGIAYTGNYRGQISFYDTAFRFKQLIDTFQWGASHDIPITLSLPSLGPFQLAPSFGFKERWYAQKFFRTWNPTTEKLDTSIQKGFYAAREMTMGLSFSTAIFGTYQSKNKEARVQAIRHVLRPQMSINYKPDLMAPYYYREQVNKSGNVALLSVFDGSLYGPFSPEKNGGIGFSLDNNLEMKVRSKTDSGEAELKKVKLLDGFGVSGGYNFLVDSFKLSTFNLYARSNLFEKINITANAILDPYQTDPSTGQRKNTYAWNGNKFNLGSLVSGSVNVSANFQSKKGNDKKKKPELDEDVTQNLTNDQIMSQMEYMRRNPAEFTDFSIPWSINISYSLSFAKLPQPDYTFKNQVTSSFNFNGDFSLSPKWKIGGTGFYDLNTKKLQSLTTFISRDLHCWQMSINVTPIGLYRYFNITISPKSGLLRDLKVNRTRYFYTQ
jgi:lipopolysaccharide assembly outer membrane protein LptD (OstA)